MRAKGTQRDGKGMAKEWQRDGKGKRRIAGNDRDGQPRGMGGTSRTHTYRQSQRKPDAIQDNGTRERGAAAHGWRARALAWDKHLGSLGVGHAGGTQRVRRSAKPTQSRRAGMTGESGNGRSPRPRGIIRIPDKREGRTENHPEADAAGSASGTRDRQPDGNPKATRQASRGYAESPRRQSRGNPQAILR